MTSLKFYYDYLSQPARAVGMLLEAGQVAYEKTPVKLVEGQHRTDEEFGKACPTRLVPAINDHGFCLFESSAILKYLVHKYKLPDHWYPSDVQCQARVDEYLGWHYTNLRRGATGIILSKYGHMFFGLKPPNLEKLGELEDVLKKSKDMMENYFLKDRKFIGGDDISVADLQAVCEFTQFWMMHIDPSEDYPRIAQWMKDVQATVGPAFEEVHKIVYTMRDQKVFQDK